MITAFALALLTPTAQPPAAPSAPVDVKECTAKGLKWLAEQQELEGNWFGRANSAPTTTTAMAGLALLMEGSTLKTGTYAPNLRKAVEWMEKIAAADGSLVGTNRTDTTRPINTHAHALLFLACAYDVDDDPARRERLGRILERAITYATSAQTADGAWRATSARNGLRNADAPATVAMLHALYAARKAGIDVPRDTTDKAVDFLAKATTESGVGRNPKFGPDEVGPPPHTTAGAAAALLMHDGPRPSAFIRWIRYLQTIPVQPWPTTANAVAMSAQLHRARLAFALGENGHRSLDPRTNEANRTTWSRYRAKVFPTIKAAQAADGSWADTVPGPVYGSAVALIVLQMENDYLPAFSR
jgi:hypothetical protein